MVIYDYDLEEYNIWHMMIDERYQGKGYGKAAMQKCLSYISEKPFGYSDKASLTCHKENTTALALYRALGFVETGNCDEEEIELAKKMETPDVCPKKTLNLLFRTFLFGKNLHFRTFGRITRLSLTSRGYGACRRPCRG